MTEVEIMNCLKGSAVVVAVMLLLIPTSEAQAQSGGCPWCTSPSVCERIDESAADSCTLTGDDWCRNGTGLCIIVETDEELASMVEAGSQVRSVALSGQSVTLLEVGDGQYAAWNCSGQIALLYQLHEGELTPLEISPLDMALLRLARATPDFLQGLSGEE